MYSYVVDYVRLCIGSIQHKMKFGTSHRHSLNEDCYL